MYQPPIFREDRTDVMQALMREHIFATLVSSTRGALAADHLPLMLHAEPGKLGVLRGHLAIANPLARRFRSDDDQANDEQGCDVLAIFQGPQAYVTPSWYASKAEHGKVVPTWNYAVVHAHGVLRPHREPRWLMDHLSALTQHNEGQRSEPWAVSDAPPAYLDRQFKGILGIEIEITALEGKWKVSQNKNEHDRNGVAAGLAAEGTVQAGAVSQLVLRYGTGTGDP